MDKALRRLRRIATNGSPEAQQRYIAALERVVGGQEIEEGPLGDANIASCDVPSEEQENVSRDLDLLNSYTIRDDSGNRVGFMVDVYWEDGFDPESEWGAEQIKDIESQLSDYIQARLVEASQAGYHMIVFWR
jgi:hypothetical protein